MQGQSLGKHRTSRASKVSCWDARPPLRGSARPRGSSTNQEASSFGGPHRRPSQYRRPVTTLRRWQQRASARFSHFASGRCCFPMVTHCLPNPLRYTISRATIGDSLRAAPSSFLRRLRWSTQRRARLSFPPNRSTRRYRPVHDRSDGSSCVTSMRRASKAPPNRFLSRAVLRDSNRHLGTTLEQIVRLTRPELDVITLVPLEEISDVAHEMAGP
jgi:hypothetical protein